MTTEWFFLVKYSTKNRSSFWSLNMFVKVKDGEIIFFELTSQWLTMTDVKDLSKIFILDFGCKKLMMKILEVNRGSIWNKKRDRKKKPECFLKLLLLLQQMIISLHQLIFPEQRFKYRLLAMFSHVFVSFWATQKVWCCKFYYWLSSYVCFRMLASQIKSLKWDRKDIYLIIVFYCNF